MYEYLKAFFGPSEFDYTLNELKKELELKNAKELITVLQKLELDGKIYFDYESRKYKAFPSNFFVANIAKINKENNKMVININNQEVTLPLNDDSLKNKDIIIIAQNQKGKYRIIKKLDKVTSNNKKLEDEIINIFYPLSKGITLKDLKKRVNHLEDAKDFEIILKELEQEGFIYFDDYEFKYYPMPSNYIVAKVECSKKGLMYIKIDDKTYFLDDKNTIGALVQDKVIFEKNGKNLRLVKILERENGKIVCEVTSNGIKAVGNSNLKVRMAKNDLEDLGLSLGTRFLASIGTEQINDIYTIKYLETIGHKDELDAELKAIAYNNGFTTIYTEEELAQVENTPSFVTEKDKENRIDLTDETIFTIDGEHTKDMDDAIGLKILENGNYELTVAIAAVAHYIPFKSPLWNRAEKNTTSLYMIDSVSHMLHTKISNGICSLNPNVERLAKAFRIEIDKNGNVIDFHFFDAVIKSRKKMTYEDVNKILCDNIVPEEYEDYTDILLKMDDLSKILSEKRQKAGSVDFDSREIRFVLDDSQNIVDIETIKEGPAEKLIENFMVLTNECMAEFMLNLGITFIYRNHEVPLNKKVLETANFIKSLGYSIDKIKNTDNPHVIQKMIQSISTKEEFFILSSLLLRSMQKAYYSSENKGHYALALNAYSQTTSPIRRFLDLLIQYILDNLDKICDPSYDMNTLKEYVNEMCNRASYMERCAEKAEYEADRLYMVNYCIARKDEVYEGFIQEITPRYIVVKTPELIEGIVYFDDLNNGNYIYNPDTKSLENKKNNERIIVGTKLALTLKDYNLEYRILYFNATTNRDLLLTRKRS